MKKSNSGYFSHLYCNKRPGFIIPAFILLLAVACGTALYIPVKTQGTAFASHKELLDGREIYINKCGGCHSLFLPEKYNSGEWEKWVVKMEPIVEMSEKEKQLILKYLTKGELPGNRDK